MFCDDLLYLDVTWRAKERKAVTFFVGDGVYTYILPLDAFPRAVLPTHRMIHLEPESSLTPEHPSQNLYKHPRPSLLPWCLRHLRLSRCPRPFEPGNLPQPLHLGTLLPEPLLPGLLVLEVFLPLLLRLAALRVLRRLLPARLHGLAQRAPDVAQPALLLRTRVLAHGLEAPADLPRVEHAHVARVGRTGCDCGRVGLDGQGHHAEVGAESRASEGAGLEEGEQAGDEERELRGGGQPPGADEGQAGKTPDKDLLHRRAEVHGARLTSFLSVRQSSVLHLMCVSAARGGRGHKTTEPQVTYTQHPMQHSRRSKRQQEHRVWHGEIVEPQDAARLQPRHRYLRHAPQQPKGPVAGENLQRRHETLPQLDARPLMDALDLGAQLHRHVVLTRPCRRGQFHRDGLRERRDVLDPGRVVGGRDEVLGEGGAYKDRGDGDGHPPRRAGVNVDMLEEELDARRWAVPEVETQGVEIADRLGDVVQRVEGEVGDRIEGGWDFLRRSRGGNALVGGWRGGIRDDRRNGRCG